MNLPVGMSLQTADKQFLTSRAHLLKKEGNSPTGLASEQQQKFEGVFFFFLRNYTFKRNQDNCLYYSYRQVRFELVRQKRTANFSIVGTL